MTPIVAVVGGGQLARMMAGPATALGITLRVLVESHEAAAALPAHQTVVGTYHRSRKFGFVRPQAPTTLTEVLIPDGDEKEAREGDVVVVRITAYGSRRLGPVGTVESVLGAPDDPGSPDTPAAPAVPPAPPGAPAAPAFSTPVSARRRRRAGRSL